MTRALAGGAVIAALTFGAIWAAVSWTPPDPTGCAVLLQQADHTSDVAVLIDEAGCLQTPAAHDPTARP